MANRQILPGSSRPLVCISGIEMMRSNPTTGQRFHRGDEREDGFVFFAYTNKVKSDGYFKEIWLSPGASRKALVGDKMRKRKARGHRVDNPSANS